MKPSLILKITSILLILHAVIWFGFGIAVLLRLHPALPADPLWVGLMGGSAFAAAAIFILLPIFLQKRSKPAFYCSVAFLGMVAMVTVLDDVGLSDLMYLAATILPLVLILVNKKQYLCDQGKTA